MSSFGKRIDGPEGRRTSAREPVALLGSVVTLHGARSVIVEDLCASGAKILGRRLPSAGKEVLFRARDVTVLGRIAWADGDFRGVLFEEGASLSSRVLEG